MNQYKLGDNVILTDEFFRLCEEGWFVGFMPKSKKVFKVVTLAYDIIGKQLVELNNDGIHYMLSAYWLKPYKRIGFLIED
jgi:pantothenate kinase-related protein Tda10